MLTSLLLLTQLSAAAPTAEELTAQIMADIQMHQEIKLVKAGAKPRQLVHFIPEPGTTGAYEVRSSQEIGLSMVGPDGKAIELGGMGELSPTTTMRFQTEVGQPVAKGLVPVGVKMVETQVEGVPPEIQAQMTQALTPMEGLSYTLLIDKKGTVTQVDIDPTLEPAMFESLQSMVDGFLSQAPTFPSEPVGVGAVWTLDQQMSVAGLELITTQTLEVTALTRETIDLDITFSMTLGDSKIELPGLPPGASVDVGSFEGSGSGHLTTRLTNLVTTGQLTNDLQLAMKVAAKDQSMDLKMSVRQTTVMK